MSAINPAAVVAATAADTATEAAKARIAALEAEITALKKSTKRIPKTEVSELKLAKFGKVSVYGLQKFPITLAHDQWEVLFAAAERIRGFVDANKSQLMTRQESYTAKQLAGDAGATGENE